ncbi:ribosome hibernation-promoting factor, HPF/YfiA family [Proteiniclasticum sp.]|uniref:ribosome hibernation-promoting factor, HPF/YfiA family n=1 Tax=Proteiniclasticum sp. TaxID=2053595 RepID=UPI00289C5A04|nr:ribosome-associated translation inhibitor RaiA [Proteiniclasticum sp.]
MKTYIYARNITLTDGLKEAVENKLNRLDKYFNQPVEARATLSVTKMDQIFEVTIPFGSVLLRAEESSDDMYKSIDLVQDKLERQIRKYKTKIERKAGDSSVRFNDTAFVRDEEADDDSPKIVRTKKISMKPMSKEEAVLQMELLGHSFYVFEDTDGETSVVYKRKDGNYGLLEREEE